MRVWASLWILLIASSAIAQPPADGGRHAFSGKKWLALTQYEKAVEEFEQAYQIDETAIYLLWIADSYERLADLATKTPAEVIEYKQRALELYKMFVAKAPGTEPRLEEARSRIEPLRQEIKELTEQVADHEVSTKVLNENIKQLLTEIRALRELLLHRPSGERAAVSR